MCIQHLPAARSRLNPKINVFGGTIRTKAIYEFIKQGMSINRGNRGKRLPNDGGSSTSVSRHLCGPIEIQFPAQVLAMHPR